MQTPTWRCLVSQTTLAAQVQPMVNIMVWRALFCNICLLLWNKSDGSLLCVHLLHCHVSVLCRLFLLKVRAIKILIVRKVSVSSWWCMCVCTQTDGTSKVGLYHRMFKATFRVALKDDQMKKKKKNLSWLLSVEFNSKFWVDCEDGCPTPL